MLRAQGRVPAGSFVFERTFSRLSPLPYSPANSRITASCLISSSLLPVPSVIADCLFGRILMFGGSPIGQSQSPQISYCFVTGIDFGHHHDGL